MSLPSWRTTVVIGTFILLFGYVVFSLVNAIRSMRVDQEVELAGFDVPEFGMLAYPEDEALPAMSALESRAGAKA